MTFLFVKCVMVLFRITRYYEVLRRDNSGKLQTEYPELRISLDDAMHAGNTLTPRADRALHVEKPLVDIAIEITWALTRVIHQK